MNKQAWQTSPPPPSSPLDMSLDIYLSNFTVLILLLHNSVVFGIVFSFLLTFYSGKEVFSSLSLPPPIVTLLGLSLKITV